MSKSIRGIVLRILAGIFPFHSNAYTAEAKPIQELFNANQIAIQTAATNGVTPREIDECNRHAQNVAIKFQAASQGQLNFIAVTAALVAGIVASGFTWPDVAESAWTVKCCFYTSLILALGSIHTATQQAVALSRIGAGPNQVTDICKLFVERLQNSQLPVVATPEYKIGAWQLYVWQIPISLLSMSVYVFVVGLAVLVWDEGNSVQLLFERGETKIVITFMITLAGVVFSVTASGISLYSRVK